MKLLHIDSSVLGAGSASRALTADIVARQVKLHPGIDVIYRDLAADAALHLSPAHLAAWQGHAVNDAQLVPISPRGVRTCRSSRRRHHCDRRADVQLLHSEPAQSLGRSCGRCRQDFPLRPNGPEGLLSGAKKVFIASSRGNVYTPGSPAAPFEHHESYLISILNFIGLTDVTVVRAEGLAFGPEAREAAMLKAREHIAAIAA
jgi:FMN-dependent NADH-azoreductase